MKGVVGASYMRRKGFVNASRNGSQPQVFLLSLFFGRDLAALAGLAGPMVFLDKAGERQQALPTRLPMKSWVP
jgi:hypothetical protein